MADDNNALLDIFLSEEDKKGTNLLEMSNFLDTCEAWEVFEETTGLFGQIAAAIKRL